VLYIQAVATPSILFPTIATKLYVLPVQFPGVLQVQQVGAVITVELVGPLVTDPPVEVVAGDMGALVGLVPDPQLR
jgi:hypothetical protein